MNRLLCALVLFACMGTNQPVSAASKGAAQTPKNSPDAQIEQTIKNKLAKSKMNADHFTVTVSKGVATIEGTTSIIQHKGAMTRMARTSGAITVHNNIRISDDAKAKAIAHLTHGKSSTPAVHDTVNVNQGITTPVPHAQVLTPAAQK
jgi:hypothetical protein